MDLTTMEFEHYMLPDGRIVPVDASASKGALTITFELKAEAAGQRGAIVTAWRVSDLDGGIPTRCYDCGHRFTIAEADDITCPCCGGTDTDVD